MCCGRNIRAHVFLLLAVLFAFLAARPAFALSYAEYTIPSASSGPTSIVAGPDGNLWFTEYDAVKIGKISTAGTVLAEYVVTGQPQAITVGPDGNLWFTEVNGTIGMLTTAGGLSEYPTGIPGSLPLGIATGPDGNLWFTDLGTNSIGKIDPATHVVTEYPLSVANSLPVDIVSGPDGNLWFTELNPALIGRITTAGVITEFPVRVSSWPRGITVGPDGNLWFTEDQGNYIGKITTAGVYTDYPLPSGTPYTASNRPMSIVTGPDGDLWFVEGDGNRLGKITTSGSITEFAALATAGAWPVDITLGPDNRIWFLEGAAGNVGVVTTASATVLGSSLNPSGSGQSVTFTATVTGNSPTGTVQFRDGATALGGPVPLSGGSATYTTSALTVGTHGITADYSGDGNNGSSTSPVLSQVVQAASSTATVTSTLNPSMAGQSVTFTATVTGNSPTGTVQFRDGATALGGPVPLSGGSATYTTSALTVGTHGITADYSGDGNNSGSTSRALTQAVNSLAPVPALSEWGLLVLAGLIGLAAFYVTRMRPDRSARS